MPESDAERRAREHAVRRKIEEATIRKPLRPDTIRGATCEHNRQWADCTICNPPR
jgi:hypothetical protein